MTETALETAAWLVGAAGLGAAALARAELSRRGELVARACHELRGPLTAARLGLVLLERAGQPHAPRAIAIDQELRRAGLALEDLDAARAGRRVRQRHEPVDIAALMDTAAEAWRPVARAVGGDVRVTARPGSAVHVRGDRERLAQACGNLLANAIEHGGGRVEVRVQATSDTARIEVRDEGPGLEMPVGALVSRRRRPGRRRGHGLALTAEIAARHGGCLAGAPTARGACLALELPLADGSQSALAAGPRPVPEPL